MSWASDVVGHADVIARLDAARSAGRLPHGLIFAGPEGVGKGTLARALCREFLQVENLNAAPDFHEVRRELIRYPRQDRQEQGHRDVGRRHPRRARPPGGALGVWEGR